MSLSAKKNSKGSSEVIFSEERRVPLSNAARDAFLRALESDIAPNAAAKAAARRYKKSKVAKKG